MIQPIVLAPFLIEAANEDLKNEGDGDAVAFLTILGIYGEMIFPAYIAWQMIVFKNNVMKTHWFLGGRLFFLKTGSNTLFTTSSFNILKDLIYIPPLHSLIWQIIIQPLVL